MQKLQNEKVLSIPTHFDLFWILFSLRGRLSLGLMWISVGMINLISAVSILMGTALSVEFPGLMLPLYAFSILFAFWSMIAITVKRCHDLGWPGWLFVLGVLPLIGPIFLLLTIGGLKGTRGANSYGLDPRRIWSAGMIDEQ